MNHQLTLEINDEVYKDLQQKANAVGISVTEWILTILSEQSIAVSEARVTPELQEQTRKKFRSYAGAISLGYATGSDNDQIDADLARAYADDY
ncbi:hypothetical protein [Vacuolonema iberomarrocanum]|uniref:hypothetical protein n=1 Tax=Vacuolonema iberomarrocanum TaxID=3454632 RepID=UPI0019DF8F88|nr:hypothetical protein [filamentous cyanobacterium LEGE 07170]